MSWKIRHLKLGIWSQKYQILSYKVDFVAMGSGQEDLDEN